MDSKSKFPKIKNLSDKTDIQKKYVYDIYDSISEQFNNTRYHCWPNVVKIMDNTKVNKLILDAGCGNGKISKEYPKHNIIEFDICKKLMSYSENKQKVYANILDIPFQESKFDVVFSIAVIHHIEKYEDRVNIIRKLYNCCALNGILQFTVWAHEEFNTYDKDVLIRFTNIKDKDIYYRYYHLFTINEIQELIRDSGLKFAQLQYQKNNWIVTARKM